MTMFAADGQAAWYTDLADEAHGILMDWHLIDHYEDKPTVFTARMLLEELEGNWPNATVESVVDALKELNRDTRRGAMIDELDVDGNIVYVVLLPGKEFQEFEERA